MKRLQQIFFVITFLFFTKALVAQACCTAGTPLLSSLEMSTASKGILSLGLSTKYNSLTDVYTGSNFLEDQERERISQSYLFEINYGLTDRISVSALFSFMRQIRKIQTISNFENVLNVSGIGDALFLAKYNIIKLNLFNRTELAFGLGGELPLGSSSVRDNSVLLPADMQPGTGSFDGLLWVYFSKGEILSPQLTFVVNSSYRLNGTNNRFGENLDSYKFGNEFILTSGFAFSTNSLYDITMLARYRNSQPDEFSSDGIPNTGGNWFYLLPGINFLMTDNLTTSITGEVPFYQDVIGTQLTTTFSISLSINYSININNNLGF
ncbi:MAG: hypothetical protein GY936_08590 [Ignavibacteriae bacterium]|nr:hypothetical protein [Ignavibacteriota bacterium]